MSACSFDDTLVEKAFLSFPFPQQYLTIMIGFGPLLVLPYRVWSLT